MACYHLSAKPIKRSLGRSACAAAAYRSGELIRDDRRGCEHDYTRRGGVDREHCAVMLPEGAPGRWADRSTLWNEVEAAEKRKDAQLAREVEVSLPRELDADERFALARDFAQREFVDRGMVADLCIHDKGDGNPHAHIMLTTRNVEDGAFGGKERAWNDKALLQQWREGWERDQNLALERVYDREGVADEERSYVDCRSFKDRGVDREPTQHEGYRVRAMEARERERCEDAGIEYEPVTTVAARNAAVRERNGLRELLERAIDEGARYAERVRRHIAELARRAHERLRADRDAVATREVERPAPSAPEPPREKSIAERIAELEAKVERETGRPVPTWEQMSKDYDDLKRLERRGISPQVEGSIHERAEAARAEAARQDAAWERTHEAPARQEEPWRDRGRDWGLER